MSLDRATAPNPYDFVPAAPAALQVSGGNFADGQPLPEDAGFAQGNVSPAIAWSGAPEETKSYLLTCLDPDAPVPGGFRHWAVVLPAEVTSLQAGAGSQGPLPEGAISLENDFGTQGYGGAAPPEGDRPHRYIFAVTALSTDEHGIDAHTSFAKAQFLNLGNVCARGLLTGTYQL